jgi:hypothetical protein
MRAIAAFILTAIASVVIVPTLPAQTQSSYLTRLIGLEWQMKPDALLKKLASEPGITRGKDWHGRPLFEGGKMLGMPARSWGVAIYDDKLMWMDCNIPAPGDELEVYQALCKKLDAVLGLSDRATTEKVRSGVQRTRFWESSMGGASGKGEVVMLRLREKSHNIVLTVRDPAQTGDFIKY